MNLVARRPPPPLLPIRIQQNHIDMFRHIRRLSFTCIFTKSSALGVIHGIITHCEEAPIKHEIQRTKTIVQYRHYLEMMRIFLSFCRCCRDRALFLLLLFEPIWCRCIPSADESFISPTSELLDDDSFFSTFLPRLLICERTDSIHYHSSIILVIW